MACDGFPTQTSMKLLEQDAGTINEIVTSDNTKTSEASDGESKHTLTGLNQLFGGINVGDYVNGTVLTEVWEYAYYSTTGIGYKIVSKSDLPYTIDATTYPDPETLVSLGVLKRTGDVNHEDVTKAQEELIPPGSQIYPRSGYLANGMTVTAGTTHLRVLVGGEPTIVAMSPVASGAVSLLTSTGATIGGVPVKFSSPLKKSVSSIDDLFALNKTLSSIREVFSTGGTSWEQISDNTSPDSDNFRALGFVHIRDFEGYVGDGVSDDSAVWQLAVTTSSKILFQGLTKFEGVTLPTSRATEIVGVGRGGISQSYAEMRPVTAGSTMFSGTSTTLRMKNILAHNQSELAGCTFVSLDGVSQVNRCEDSAFESVNAYYFEDAFVLDYCKFTKFSKCYINGGRGISIFNKSWETSITDCTIFARTARVSSGDAYSVCIKTTEAGDASLYPEGLYINGCTFDSNQYTLYAAECFVLQIANSWMTGHCAFEYGIIATNEGVSTLGPITVSGTVFNTYTAEPCLSFGYSRGTAETGMVINHDAVFSSCGFRGATGETVFISQKSGIIRIGDSVWRNTAGSALGRCLSIGSDSRVTISNCRQTGYSIANKTYLFGRDALNAEVTFANSATLATVERAASDTIGYRNTDCVLLTDKVNTFAGSVAVSTVVASVSDVPISNGSSGEVNLAISGFIAGILQVSCDNADVSFGAGAGYSPTNIYFGSTSNTQTQYVTIPWKASTSMSKMSEFTVTVIQTATITTRDHNYLSITSR